MSSLVWATVRGVLWGYTGWFISTNAARWLGREVGSTRLVTGRLRRALNRKRREIHASLAGLFLVMCVVLSLAWELTGAPVDMTRLVPLLVLLLVVEIALGGGQRKPVWAPWQVFRERGTTTGLAVETATGLPGFTELGALFDPNHRPKATGQRPRSGGKPSAVSAGALGRCPRCGSSLVRRTNSRTGVPFIGCDGYGPLGCRFTRPT